MMPAHARRRGLSRGCGGTRGSIAIAKKDFCVHPSTGSAYYDTKENAQQLVRLGHAKWDGPKAVRVSADTSKRGIWEPTMSGYAGPLVMQLS